MVTDQCHNSSSYKVDALEGAAVVRGLGLDVTSSVARGPSNGAGAKRVRTTSSLRDRYGSEEEIKIGKSFLKTFFFFACPAATQNVLPFAHV